MAERGLDISYETVRRWVVKFGTAYARILRRRRTTPSSRWHLDEMFVSIDGRRMYLWRAVDAEGEVLDILVQPRRAESFRVTFLVATGSHLRVSALTRRGGSQERVTPMPRLLKM